MIYKLTKANIYTLIRAIGYTEETQLIEFFRDVEDSYNVPYYIHNMVNCKTLNLNKYSGVVSDFRGLEVKSDVIRSRIFAFWILVALGSEKIRDISTLEYPGEISFVTTDNEVYDITYVNSISIARLSYNKRHSRELKDMPDDYTHHIAIVTDEELGKRLAPFGFESYCTLDAEHKPIFHYFGDEDEES